MPNYIMNRLKMSGEQSRIDELLASIKGEDTVIDFNKIIPMPAELDIEVGTHSDNGLKAYKEFIDVYTALADNKDLLNIPKEKEDAFLKIRKDIDSNEWELGRQAFRNELKYGFTDWYSWSIKNWGTKWDAWETAIIDDSTICFYTAWSRSMPVITKLAEMFPDIKFEYHWADEDIGVNVGFAEFENGEVVSDDFFNTQSKEAYELAAELWGLDLAEEGLTFDENNHTYEFHDELAEPQQMS